MTTGKVAPGLKTVENALEMRRRILPLKPQRRKLIQKNAVPG